MTLDSYKAVPNDINMYWGRLHLKFAQGPRRIRRFHVEMAEFKDPLPDRSFVHGSWAESTGTETITLYSAYDDSVVLPGSYDDPELFRV